MQRAFLAFLLITGLTSGCARSIHRLPVSYGTNELRAGEAGFGDKLQLKYLGAGGWLIRRGSDVVMTGPFYSNPGLLQTGLRFPIRSKTNLVDGLLPPVGDVSAILVGHAHYDHLMDVPFVAKYRATNAFIYGSRTMSNILLSAIATNRIVDAEAEAGEFTNGGRAGVWLTNSPRVRFMALRSEHAPHLGCIKLFKGKVDEPMLGLPRTAYGWREGQTLAYIIDFLSKTGSVDYRIFYHDSAVNCPPFGGWPKVGDERKPDIDILCLASFGNVTGYPEELLKNHSPKHVVIGHWEDFFLSPLKPLRSIRGTNARQFMEKVNHLPSVVLPAPGAWLRFEASSKD